MSKILKYCENNYAYRRRPTREVMVGSVGVGGMKDDGWMKDDGKEIRNKKPSKIFNMRIFWLFSDRK